MKDGEDPDNYLRMIFNSPQRERQLIKNKCKPEQIGKYMLTYEHKCASSWFIGPMILSVSQDTHISALH